MEREKDTSLLDLQDKAQGLVSIFCKEMCALMNLDTNQLAQSPAGNLNPDPFDPTNLPHTVEVLRLKITSHLKGLIEENQRQDQNYAPSGEMRACCVELWQNRCQDRNVCVCVCVGVCVWNS